jgi:glycosyltransferase domain-containing protein
MPEDLARSYTLVIPTFNRPALLGRLLRYLELQSARFSVLVLDSSTPDNKSKNAQAVASVDLRIRRLEYDTELSPFAKFLAGTGAVDTPFLSLCADDDIVIVQSVVELVEFLQHNNDYSAAHGFYFNFHENRAPELPGSSARKSGAGSHTNVTSLFYRSPSIADERPVQRVAQLFRRYEALTYAVYRTAVARHVYEESQKVESILARELLAGALTVANGKTARLKIIYYGRNTAPSAGYDNWHPLEWLATDPSGMFSEYVTYRSVLARHIVDRDTRPMAVAEALRICDLIHLRYLCPFLQPRFIDFALDKSLERLARREIITEVWKFWNHFALRSWRAKVRKILPTRVVVSGRNRYRFDPAFLYAGPWREVRITGKEIDAVVDCLNSYAAALLEEDIKRARAAAV